MNVVLMMAEVKGIGDSPLEGLLAHPIDMLLDYFFFANLAYSFVKRRHDESERDDAAN